MRNSVQQSGPGYDPQAAVMRWLPLATIAILTPGGSILTRDVRHTKKGIQMKVRTVFVLVLMVMSLLVSSCSRHPRISPDDIKRDVVGKRTDDTRVSWYFSAKDPREVSLLDSKYKGDTATIFVDMKTEEKVGGMFGTIKVAGKLRLHYEWIAGAWNLIRIENISFDTVN